MPNRSLTQPPGGGTGLVEPGWVRFISGIQKDLKLWLCMVVYLGCFRWLMILLFHAQIGADSRWTDLLGCGLNGVRFDVSVATYWMLLPLLVSIVCAWRGWARLGNRTRLAAGFLFLSLTSLLCLVTIGFFLEYHEQFNHWIFGAFFDDWRAILGTIWEQHHVVWQLLALALTVLAGAFLLERILRQPFTGPRSVASLAARPWLRVLLVLVLPVFVAGGLRGSWGRRPLQPKDTAVSRDDLLNKLIVNPYYALKFAIRAHQLLNHANGLASFLPDGDIAAAARLAFPDADGVGDLDQCLLKRARGPSSVPPRHIFLVVMESFDLWPMLPRYQALGLTPRLNELADNGIFVKAFVSAADGTMPSLSTLITGLPYVGVFANYQPWSRQPLPCSTAPIFKRLGYTTRFFYGGYLSWQRVGDFCKDQGFDEVYGGAHMTQWQPGREWGAPDAEMFQFIAKTVASEKPSFNLIMTTSYHPPYGLDVYGMGFPTREIPPSLKDSYDGKTGMKAFGHLWYADRSLGDFVAAMEQKLPATLFAITGDHWSRKFLNATPSLYERTAVPCVLYGRDVLAAVAHPTKLAGAHIDIVPTLIELAAPAGFAYHSFGCNFLDARGRAIGFGLKTVVSPDFIFDVDHPDRFEALSDPVSPNLPDSLAAWGRLHQATHALGWWRGMKGDRLPTLER